MNEATLPPSPNWYRSSILSCAKDGTVAWGSRNAIVIAENHADKKSPKYSLISNAHSDKVTSVCFSPEYGEPGKKLIVSGAEEHIVRIWNLETMSAAFSQQYMDTKQKVVAVDWSKCNPDLICFVSTEGFLMAWTVSFNACQQYSFGKFSATCLSCSPHKSNIVAIGTKNGLVNVVNLQGNGTINYKLRGHDVEITSLSWCPTEVNILTDSKSKDMLLASGAKDRSIFIWRAGGDGRSQMEISLPVKPLDSNQHRVKLGSTGGNWTPVYWAEPKLLFAASSWGELISWDFTMGGKSKPICKLQHGNHVRGLFCISHVPKKNQAEEENWRESSPLTIWTIAQDRQVIRSSISATECKNDYTVPTQGGYVYCIAASPLDTSQIAFGVGDAMLRLWNLSEPHETNFAVTTIWQKIMGTVRSVAWHPEKENLLAFGTGEGRVGVCDTNTTKPPTLYRQHHRHTVYSIGWGPNPNDKSFVLYSCGDGELVYYPSTKATKDVKIVVKKDCTEFAWKPDHSCIAVGYEGGSISFFDRELKEIGQPIYSLKKAVQCLAWHPDSTATDLNISPLRNYLAVAINDSTITIFDVKDLMDGLENTWQNSESLTSADSTVTQHKVIANLCGHVEKVVALAWSPHFSGHLVSGSYDFTAQVWKVETQELIATYTGHTAPVHSCMWSPIDPDYIITGSSDFTVRVWKISDQKVVIPTENRQAKRTKNKKKNKNKNASKAATGEIIKNGSPESSTSPTSLKDIQSRDIIQPPSESDKEVSQKVKKERTKKNTYFAAYSRRMNNKTIYLESLKKQINKARTQAEGQNETNGKIDEDSEKFASVFGGPDEISLILNQEDASHCSQGQYNTMMEMSLWDNSLRKKLQDATKDKRLNDFMVSLSSSLSMKTWQETCEAYATQLIFENNPTKAVSYLLCIHKIPRAVEVFMNEKMYREAYVLARCKLDPEDPIFTTILEDWANNAAREGNFEDAAQCYTKLGDYAKAARFIGRRKNVESLEVAVDLSLLSDEPGLSESLADQAFTEALLASDCAAARRLVEKYPQIAYREVQIQVFEEINKALDTSDTKILPWLESKNEYGLLQTLRGAIPIDCPHYAHLTPNPNSTTPGSKSMLWVVVSQHIAMAITAPTTEKKMSHLVAALGDISKYEYVYTDNNAEGKNDKFLLLRFLSILEAKSPIDEESLFSKQDDPVYTSLRAFLCDGLLNWAVENDVKESEGLDIVLGVIQRLLKDVLDQQTVNYWSTNNEINKLEVALASAIGKSQNGENGDEKKGHTTALLKKLDEIRNERKRFIEERVCAPSPIVAYFKASALLNRLTVESSKADFTKILEDTWSKATS